MNLQEEMQDYLQRKKDNKDKKLKNSNLPLEAGFYFYCRHCFIVTDTLPGDIDLTKKPVVSTICSRCENLERNGMLN